MSNEEERVQDYIVQWGRSRELENSSCVDALIIRNQGQLAVVLDFRDHLYVVRAISDKLYKLAKTRILTRKGCFPNHPSLLKHRERAQF
jgi:protein-arginine kinase